MSGKEVLGGARGSSVHSSDVVDKLLGTDYTGASILGASSFSSHRELGIFWQLLSYVGASSLMSQVFSKTYKGRTVLREVSVSLTQDYPPIIATKGVFTKVHCRGSSP